MSFPVILLGAGGHAKVLLSVLRRQRAEVLGVVDPALNAGDEWLGCPVLGSDEALLGYRSAAIELVNGVGSLPRDGGVRARLFQQFVAQGYRFRTLIDDQAWLADRVELAQGVQVMAGVIIQSGTNIAENVIVNSGAIVEHDGRIGRDCHIAPGATLCGGVWLGDAVHVGAGSTIIQGIHVGSHSVIGAGAVVSRDVGERKVVYPARAFIRDL